MRYLLHIIGVSFAISALFWTGAGQTSDPQLNVAELPADVLSDCATGLDTANRADAACGKATFRTQWIARSSSGEVFLVEREVCKSDGCRRWLVSRDSNGATRTLLAAVGELRLESNSGKLPIVYARLELANSYTSYTRFEWNDNQYVRTETRLVFRVDGQECADDVECRSVADDALRHDNAGRAVRIWQQVHGVNWI